MQKNTAVTLCIFIILNYFWFNIAESVHHNDLKSEIESRIKDELGITNIHITNIHNLEKLTKSQNIQIISLEDKGNCRVMLNIIDYLGKKYSISAKYEELIEVSVPIKDIEKGEALKEEDFKLSMLSLGKTKYLYILNIVDKINNKESSAKHKLLANKPIKLSDIESQVILHKGQAVKLEFHKHNLTIESLGVCLMSGAVGDIIKVKNLDTNKVLQGVIINSNIVSIVTN